MPSILTILDWMFYGLVRYVLALLPLVKAPRVDRNPPSEYWRYNGYSDWLHLDDDGGYPDEHWARSWLEMAFGELQRLATEKARPYADAVFTLLRHLLGYIRPAFSAMGAWVDFLQSAIGYVMPYFAANLGAATVWLYDRLPGTIKYGWGTWGDLWEQIKSSVRSWAQSRYDQARQWAYDARVWLYGVGDRIRRWYDRTANWLDGIRSNPYGWIAGSLGAAWWWLVGFYQNAWAIVLGWLGPEWPNLVTFGRDCVSFYYNLWSEGWDVLGDFVADPRSFLLDRFESAVMDRW